MRISLKYFLILFAALIFSTLVGCIDQDPFGLSTRTILGKYSLNQWEDEATYYLVAPGANDGGGVIEGTVQQLGWNRDIILAERLSTFRGDPDGWMVIEVAKHKVTGPFTTEQIKSNPTYAGIKIFSAAEAWKKLK
jgi:hypothetical protein